MASLATRTALSVATITTNTTRFKAWRPSESSYCKWHPTVVATRNFSRASTLMGNRLSRRAFSSSTFHDCILKEDVANVDTLIIGGGPMGSCTAYHLAQMQKISSSASSTAGSIVVLEQDPTYQSCSATVSAGGVRQHFSLEENVKMSMYGRDFLRNAHNLLATEKEQVVDVQFVEHGYLFLATNQQGKQNMMESNAIQRKAGCTTTQLLSREQLQRQFPWLHTDDILLGSYGTSGEGWFDPWAFLRGLKKKNQELGVTYLHAKPIQATRDEHSGRILSVDVQLLSQHGDNPKSNTPTTLKTLHVNNVVNAAGAHAVPLMDLLAGGEDALEYPLPVRPRKRCIFYFHCSPSNGEPQDSIVPEIAPLTVDSSNVYFRSEGKPGSGTFICGVSPACEDDVDCFEGDQLVVTQQDYQRLFEGCIWPSIYHRVPAFANIKVMNQWAGLYEYNVLDQNAIIDFHPELPNVLMVNGFSGHGLQQSPAAGRAAAELLFDGRFQSLDLNIFRFDRCIGDYPPVIERGIV